MGNNSSTPIPQYTQQTVIDCSQAGNIQAELQFLESRILSIEQLCANNYQEYLLQQPLLENQYNFCKSRIPILREQLRELRSRCGFNLG